nr:MAG TPA: hypothetical protein [Caudoviricetes sp.]
MSNLTFTSTSFGFSAFGLPVLGLNVSPLFLCSDKSIILCGTQKVNSFLKLFIKNQITKALRVEALFLYPKTGTALQSGTKPTRRHRGYYSRRA